MSTTNKTLGISTKVGAGAFTAATFSLIYWVLFTWTTGPEWAAPPVEVWINAQWIVSVVVAWWVPEKALQTERVISATPREIP